MRYIINLTDVLGNRVEGVKVARESVLPATITITDGKFIKNDVVILECEIKNAVLQAYEPTVMTEEETFIPAEQPEEVTEETTETTTETTEGAETPTVE